MTDKLSADLTHEIGEMVVDNFNYRDDSWQGIALAVTLYEGCEELTGYQYFSDGGWEAGGVKKFGDLLDKLLELKEHMGSNGEGAFVQCLIHVTKPDYKLRIQYEHDNPKRWSPTISADMGDFAELLRPEPTPQHIVDTI